MKIWVDGDACPKVIKAILFRAAIRTQTFLILVSNHPLSIPVSPLIKKHQVSAGLDVADHYIVNMMQSGDLVITGDIPFADEVITKGGLALSPRGVLYTENEIKQQLALRNFHDVLRSCQLISGGPSTLGQRDVREFSNHLDKILAQKRA